MINTIKDLELNIIKELKNNSFSNIIDIVQKYNGNDWKKYIDNTNNNKDYNKKNRYS